MVKIIRMRNVKRIDDKRMRGSEMVQIFGRPRESRWRCQEKVVKST